MSAAPVRVVTDSTSYLPASAVTGVTVVPLKIDLGGRVGAEGTDVEPAAVAAALRAGVAVLTSRPQPREFSAAYRAAFAAGAVNVVSIHLSAKLSGTVDAARLAASEFPAGSVLILDSQTVAMGLGFAVLAAEQAAASGADASTVLEAARLTAQSTTAFFYVDSIQWLRRGGRIGAGSALLGGALAVKPILTMAAGNITVIDKVRTTSRAVDRLISLVQAAAGHKYVDVAVQHLDAASRAGDVALRLRDALPGLGECAVSEVGAVVGAHTGPGLVSAVVHPTGLNSAVGADLI